MNGSAETAPRLSFPTALGGGTMLTFSSDSAAEDESTKDIPATPFTRLVAPPPFAAAAEDAVVVVVTLYEYSDDLLLLVVLAWLIRCDDGDKGPFEDDCGCFEDVSKRLAFIVVVVELLLLLLLTPFTAFCS